MKTYEDAFPAQRDTCPRNIQVKLKSFMMCALLCMFFVLTGMRVQAAVAIVDDAAGLLTSNEIASLQQSANRVSSTYKMDVMLITTGDTDGRTSGTYAEDYFLAHCSGDDGFVMIIDMDNREINVRTSGAAIPYMTDERQERLLDDGYDQITSSRYAATLGAMLSDMESFLRAGVPSGQYTVNEDTGEITHYKEPKSLSPMEFVLSLLAGLVGAGGIFGAVSGKYKMKTGGYRYNVQKNMALKLMDRTDQLENRFVTRRHIPRTPPPSSHSGGHSSGHTSVHIGSGGHTFGGGGGRKF